MEVDQLIDQFGEGEVTAQFVSVAIDHMDHKISDRNFERLKESVYDADYYMCSDEGLILNSIDNKRQKLEFILAFMDWAGLRRASINPSGILFNYVPSGTNPDQFYTFEQLGSDLSIKLNLQQATR